MLPAANLALNTTEDTALPIPDTTLTSGVTDVDSSSFTVNIVSGPTSGNLTRVAGGYSFVPALNSNGNVTFTYTVTDNGAPPATSNNSRTVVIIVGARARGTPWRGGRAGWGMHGRPGRPSYAWGGTPRCTHSRLELCGCWRMRSAQLLVRGSSGPATPVFARPWRC